MRQYVNVLGLDCIFGWLTSDFQTSALDTYTEQALLGNINSILKEKVRTSVFVAHRLRTIYDSDMIIVLKDGNVAEQGTHERLIDSGGVYSELWSGEYETTILDGWQLTMHQAQEMLSLEGEVESEQSTAGSSKK